MMTMVLGIPFGAGNFREYNKLLYGTIKMNEFLFNEKATYKITGANSI